MPINFPDSPTNGQEITHGDGKLVYNSTKGIWNHFSTVAAAESSGGGASVVATHDLLPTSPSAGDMALVSSVNKMYVYFLSGWWLMSSLQNASPSGITGNAAIYDLAADGTPTTVTLSSSDPEGFPISWSHSIISGSLGGTTVTNVDNVFTITPSTDAADAGTFTLRFAATDGQGGESGSQSNFTLDFVFIVANSRYTTLLATATGTSDNNNITDNSSNNHSITVNGDAHAGTFSPYRSRGYSTYFEDTAANVLYASPSSDFAFGTGAFTISVWVKLLHQWLGTIFDTNDGSNPGVMMSVNNTTFYTYSNTWLSSTPTSSQDVWQHFCWTRDGSGNNKVFVNGTQATTFTDSTNYTSQNFKMGEEQNGTNDLKAYIKDLHIVKGYAYEPDSTYADGAAEPTTGTVFLGCGLPYHGDKSSSPKTLTIANSGISIVNDTPHDYSEYSATDHGGSVYFDGTGDALRIADNSNIQLGTSAFTIEGWFYCNNTTPTQGIAAKRDASGEYWRWIITGGNLNFRFQSVGGGSFTFNTVPVPANTWCHFAVTRDSNNDVRQFINGISTQNAINSTGNFDISGSTLRVGEYELNTGHFNGFVSDIKIVKNSALYTSDFTPPTAPLSSSGAIIHIKGTDASIIDKSQGTNLKLFGNTTGSTTQVKFIDTKSMYFDGSGDYLTFPDRTELNFASNDWTIECWIYPKTNVGDCGIWHQSASGGLDWFGLYLDGSFNPKFVLKNNNAEEWAGTAAANTAPQNTWTHIALVRRFGIDIKLYANGNVVHTETQNLNVALENKSYNHVIGYERFVGSGTYFDGYIQDFRITNGLARYTANFTPPTASLEG